jgi:hypothetical protein
MSCLRKCEPDPRMIVGITVDRRDRCPLSSCDMQTVLHPHFLFGVLPKSLLYLELPCIKNPWFDMIKARAHKGGVRIGKTPKKLASICCPQCRETKADTLKQLRPIGEGEQELEKR